MVKDFFNLVNHRHIDLFCEILAIGKNEIRNIYVNPGRSANNSNLVFVVNDNSYLYRIPGKGTEKFCSRIKEALGYKVLAPLKITDEVIYLSEETGIKISKYYVDSKIPNRTNKEELIASMQLLRYLHAQKIEFPYKDTLFDRMERYRKFVYEVNGEHHFLPGFDEYLEKMMEFKKYLKKKDVELCFTHGDASINNILITKDYKGPILIDIEFPAVADPFEDIATFCVDAEYRKDNIILMLDYYLDRKSTLSEQYHVLGLSAVAAMMWYSWAAYKSTIEEDNKLFLDFRDDYHQYVQDVYSAAIEIYKEL